MVEPHRNHILRHPGPVLPGGGNSLGPLIIAVVVGKAEHTESNVVQRVGNVAGRGETGVAGRGKGIIDKGFLVEPVHVKAGIKRPHVLIGR